MRARIVYELLLHYARHSERGYLKDKLEDGDKEKIEAAVQETLGWLKATIEIDSLFEGTDYSCSLSRALFEELALTTL